jgi:hypothetical protein
VTHAEFGHPGDLAIGVLFHVVVHQGRGYGGQLESANVGTAGNEAARGSLGNGTVKVFFGL